MSEQESPSEDAGPYTLPLELSPAEAAQACDAILGELAKAREAGQPFVIESSGEQVTPCALQILVAAELSAKAANVELKLSDTAANALAGVRSQ